MSAQSGFNLGQENRYWLPHLYEASAKQEDRALANRAARPGSGSGTSPLVGILPDDRSSAETEAIRKATLAAGARTLNIDPGSDVAALGLDLVVGSLTNGWYADYIVAPLAHGIPVVAHINDSVRREIPELPIVEATTWTVTRVMEDLFSASDSRMHLAERCIVYANTHHSYGAFTTYFTKLFSS